MGCRAQGRTRADEGGNTSSGQGVGASAARTQERLYTRIERLERDNERLRIDTEQLRKVKIEAREGFREAKQGACRKSQETPTEEFRA